MKVSQHTPPPESASDESGRARFQDRIYRELDAKLRRTPWNAGVSEAHGLLVGLACLGVSTDAIRASAWLMRLEADEDVQLIEGLYAMVRRDLEDSDFRFEPMLADDAHSLADRVESVVDWCQGFLQGVYHRDGRLPVPDDTPAAEAVADIRRIGHLEADPGDPQGSERALVEITEFLRVAAQLVHDELQPGRSGESAPAQLN